MASPRSDIRNEDILVFIATFIGERGYSPTFREIGAGVGFGSIDTVHRRLKTMKKQGKVDFLSGSARTLRIL